MNLQLNELDALSVPISFIIGAIFKKIFPRKKRWTVHVTAGLTATIQTIAQTSAMGVKPAAAIIKGITSGLVASGIYEAAEPIGSKINETADNQ